jgi:predicted AlkP superfamily phosphohydrolase/phosphomutase
MTENNGHLMNKYIVIGIDGVPYELLQQLAESGVMPNVQRLIRRYSLIRTQVPLPEISSVSWTSFMTGMNPGQHGVYGFMELNPRNYSYTFPSFKTLPVKTHWEQPHDQDKKTIVLNLPSTYPARPLNGVMVSGFVALDLEKAIYPPTLFPYLEEIDYQVDVDTTVGRSDKKRFIRELSHMLQMRFELFKRLDALEQWHRFYFIITGTDRLHHFLFDAYQDHQSPYHQGFLAYYRQLDQVIAAVTDDMEKRGIPFIILSDHGFVQIQQEVYISQYLKRWGFLHMEEERPKNLKSISSKSRVFALDPSRIYIHLQDKYARGKVKKDQYQPLRDEIKARFLDLEIDSKKVIKAVYFKEEIYNGPYLDKAPDIVLQSQYGFDLKSGVTKSALYGKTHFSGMHSQDNALLIDSRGLSWPHQSNIVDIGKSLI